MRRALPALVACLVALAGACGRTLDGASSHGRAGDHDASAPTPFVADAGDSARAPPSKLVLDEAVGPLIARLSESPGDFPSDNYVSNELSLLETTRQLSDPRLKGRAFVGVGPEQSLTLLALLEPRVAYIVDIRRGNLLEHMMFRGCFEIATTRAEFLSALLARRPSWAVDRAAGFAALEATFRSVPMDPALRDQGIARTQALLDRLGVARARSDDEAIARIHGAFASHGLSIRYSMRGTHRAYPSFAETLSVTSADGAAGSFLASEASYARVRRMVVDNRVLPIVGDFGGAHALRAVAVDMRARGLTLGVFYTSNVEQYLFDDHRHGELVASVASMPRDDASRLVRVWFDQGRAHPAQREGRRTTQVTITTDVFLERARSRPFRSYWEVVTHAD